MKILKHIFLCILTVGLFLSAATTSYAEEVPLPDTSRTGSVSVTLKDDGKVLTGGSLELYLIALINTEKGTLHYDITEDFQYFDLDTVNLSAKKQAALVEHYIEEHNLSGIEMPVGEDGVAGKEGLKLGIYFVKQGEESDNYVPINSFIITIPMKNKNAFIYDVDATPKVETSAPDTPDTPPDTPKPPLPQTGQLWWPVPILLVLGFWLIVLGIIRRRGDRYAY